MYKLDDLVEGGTGFQLIQAAFSINGGAQILTSGFTGSARRDLLFNPVPEANALASLALLLLVFTISRRFPRGEKHL